VAECLGLDALVVEDRAIDVDVSAAGARDADVDARVLPLPIGDPDGSRPLEGESAGEREDACDHDAGRGTPHQL
jgi:hypothetical protein